MQASCSFQVGAPLADLRAQSVTPFLRVERLSRWNGSCGVGDSHRPLSSSFLGLPYWILNSKYTP